MGIVAPTRENFESMLANDKQIFNMLVTLNIWLFRRPQNKTSPKYSEYLKLYQTQLNLYSKRQNDYKTNTLYKISNQITAIKDNVVNFFSDAIKSFGLGDGGLISVPIAIVIGATISVAVIAYFISSYYTETNTGFAALTKILPELSEKDPKLAKQIVDGVAAQEKTKAESGFFNQLGQGAKIGISLAGAGIIGFGFYKIAKSQNWI